MLIYMSSGWRHWLPWKLPLDGALYLDEYYAQMNKWLKVFICTHCSTL